MYVYHVCAGAHGGQKRKSGLLGLELLTVLSCYVDGGNQIWVLWKSNQCS